MSGLPKVAAVVVNYGSHALLARNLAQVSAANPDLRVVVVDNFSTSAELEAVTELCDQHGWRLVASPTNTGFGGGNNLGAATALDDGADQVLLLNPDARIDTESLRRLVEVVSADPMTLVSPLVETVDGRVWFDGTDLHLDRGRMRASRKRSSGDRVEQWLSGACLLVSRQLWERLQGFDERFFLYWEDVDLSWRARRAGGTLQVVRDARAVHDEGGTQQESGSRARSETYYYYNVRNRLLFAALHLGPADRRRWVATSIAEARGIVLRGGRRQLIESVVPWRAAFTGTRDGLRLLRRTAPVDEDPRPVRVLQSFPQPRPTTNPYICMLKDSLDAHPGVDVSTFSWRRALTDRYDVFHAHWPEILVAGSSPSRRLVRQLMFALFLARLKFTRTGVVRTLHNLKLPEGITRREIALLRWFEQSTDLLITINTSPPLTDLPYEMIVHGHYRDWFAPYPRETPVPGRLAYFGLVRRYKAVDTLLAAFRETAATAPELSLYVGGKPSTEELRRELLDLADPDPRITTHLAFLTDAELVAAASAAQVVVLPYREMHNSGGVLAALSLDRRVLVPDNPVNRLLADEVGAGWVQRYYGALEPDDLLAALSAEGPRSPQPDLSARDWNRAADQHLRAYQRTIALARRH